MVIPLLPWSVVTTTTVFPSVFANSIAALTASSNAYISDTIPTVLLA